MTCADLSISRDDTGDVVRRPRATDAIGLALRNAYPKVGALPDDLGRMLLALDRVPSRPH